MAPNSSTPTPFFWPDFGPADQLQRWKPTTAAVLISPEDLAASEETVAILATPGAQDAIAEGLSDLGADRIADNEALLARFSIR